MIQETVFMYDDSPDLCILMFLASRYTGKERDAESGNDYFGARYYGSSMGRMMSPDPIGIFVGGWPGCRALRCEFLHHKWVPRVPRLWAPGIAQPLPRPSSSTSRPQRCTLGDDAKRTGPLPPYGEFPFPDLQLFSSIAISWHGDGARSFRRCARTRAAALPVRRGWLSRYARARAFARR